MDEINYPNVFNSISREDDEDEPLRLPFWNANPKMNTLTAVQWIDYVEKVKKISDWNAETTMANVEKLLGKESVIRLIAKVQKSHCRIYSRISQPFHWAGQLRSKLLNLHANKTMTML